MAKLDYEEFLEGNYFKDGAIYIDEAKDTYKALNYGSKTIFSGFGMLNPKVNDNI